MQFLRNLFTLSKNVIIDDNINQNIFYILLNIDRQKEEYKSQIL